MEIYLLHMLKASIAPLVLFDRIINWVYEHSGEIKQNGTDNLMKREKLIQECGLYSIIICLFHKFCYLFSERNYLKHINEQKFIFINKFTS